MKAQQRYNELQSERQQFLDIAHECSQLTLPHHHHRNQHLHLSNYNLLIVNLT